MDFPIPWWIVALAFLLAFVYYVGIGAILGFAVTYAMLTRSARRGNRSFGRKSDRIGVSLMIGGIGGAFLQYAVVETWT